MLKYVLRNTILVFNIVSRKNIMTFITIIYQPFQPAAQDWLPTEAKQGRAGQYLDGRPLGKTRLLLEEVLVRPAGGAHPVVCVGPNAPV